MKRSSSSKLSQKTLKPRFDFYLKSVPVPFVHTIHVSVQFSWENEISVIRKNNCWKRPKSKQSTINLRRIHTQHTGDGSENSLPLPQPHSPTHLPWVVLWHINHLSRSNRMLKSFWWRSRWYGLIWAWQKKITYHRVFGFWIKFCGVGI